MLIIFPHNKIDSAYITLLSEYRGKTVDECNVLLEKLEIKKDDRLGTCARRLANYFIKLRNLR